MEFESVDLFDNLEVAYISNFSGGYISKNPRLFEAIELTKLTKFVLEKSVFGTPIFKMGDGGNKILILSIVRMIISPYLILLLLFNNQNKY